MGCTRRFIHGSCSDEHACWQHRFTTQSIPTDSWCSCFAKHDAGWQFYRTCGHDVPSTRSVTSWSRSFGRSIHTSDAAASHTERSFAQHGMGERSIASGFSSPLKHCAEYRRVAGATRDQLHPLCFRGFVYAWFPRLDWFPIERSPSRKHSDFADTRGAECNRSHRARISGFDKSYSTAGHS